METPRQKYLREYQERQAGRPVREYQESNLLKHTTKSPYQLEQESNKAEEGAAKNQQPESEGCALLTLGCGFLLFLPVILAAIYWWFAFWFSFVL